MVAFLCLSRGYDCDVGLCCVSNGICLCMFCVLPVDGLRLYCLCMFCVLPVDGLRLYCLCMFCVLPVDGLRLYCLCMFCVLPVDGLRLYCLCMFCVLPVDGLRLYCLCMFCVLPVDGLRLYCLCMFCVLPVDGLRLYCLYMICYLCGVYLIFISYFYFMVIGVMLGMESAGDVVISAGKRNADVNVAISFSQRKVDVICMLCWSCKDGLSLCWFVVALICFGCCLWVHTIVWRISDNHQVL